MFVNFCTAVPILLTGVLFYANAFAGVVEIPLLSVDQIIVSISEANVNLWPSSTQKTLKVNYHNSSESDFLLEKKENSFEIRSRDQLSKTDFEKNIKKKRELDIYYPAGLPIDLHLLEGNINLTKMTREALLHVHKGKITVKDSNGSLTLHAQKGDILVSDSQGKLSIDSYASTVTIKNVNADLDLQNFAGDSLIEKSKGFLSLTLGSGATKVVTSSGTLQFENTKGTLNVNHFIGRVEGQSADGPINVVVGSEADINIKSQLGKVSVSSAEGSGATLNLSTVEGDIYLPNYLKVNREGSQKSFRGRLKGEAGKSNIFVRSQAGTILVK